MRRSHALATAILAFAFACASPAEADDDPSFDQAIAPLLAKHCLECHGAATKEGGLDLSAKSTALAGGDSGVALVAGDPAASPAWQYVESDEMPKDRPSLTADEKETLRRWIEAGAAWTADSIDPFAHTTDRRAGYDWRFLQPIASPTPPVVADEAWPRGDVDRFVLAKLEANGLEPAPEADRRTLIRRLSFDLLGLPPDPDAVDRFVADERPDAYEALIDEFLASPRYGERWARHWLDVVRFGETQGFERNRVRENAWRYRDWVIDAINEDLPYDDFVRRQIAGDVLYPGELDALVATGYHVCGTWDQVGHFEGSKPMQIAVRWDHMEDLVATLSQTYLGLTVNCARCHDHKFDPIAQVDYYRIAAALDGVRQRVEEPSGMKLAANPRRLATADFSGNAHVPIFEQPEPMHVFARGDSRTPLQAVAPQGLSAVAKAGLPDDLGLAEDAPEGERRAKLAEWIVDRRNPLTARVFVNRVWGYHFGRGIVATPSDFGFNGAAPTHPELLDWLAAGFMADDWNVKNLHRRVVTSSAYRQASNVRSERAEEIDGENRLLWRFSMRPLEGEEVRDATLLAAGALNLQLGGPSYRDMQVKMGSNNNAEFTEPTGDFGSDANRRTIYRLWGRSGNLPLLQSLDCPEPSVTAPVRSRTVTPLQALSLFNSPIMEKCGEAFAERLRREAGDDVAGQVGRAYRLALERSPSPDESRLAIEFVEKHGLPQFCLVTFNLNEFLYVE